jgi:hypothetical protein
MYEFISLAEPAPLEPFNIDSILESMNSNSDLFEGLFGDPNAGEELQLANPLETDRMANSLSSPNVDPQNCVLPNLFPSHMARASPPKQNRRTNFFSLPAEIRLYIYELVLLDEVSIH